MEILTTREIENFGRNLRFTPQVFYEPSSEAQLLDILKRHAGQKIKAIGSKHSWSSAAECHQVVVSLRLLNEVRLCANSTEGSAAWVGGGIQIKDLLEKLSKFGKTLPSLGLITEQTIVGAISTGTHGSGLHCLSHYVQAIRIARYDETSGQPIVEVIHRGESLRAAQCGVGNLGVITSVKISCRDHYNIAEVWRHHESLEAVLKLEAQHPLQQFFLIPWKWSFLAQHRQETELPLSKLHWLYRIYFLLAIDIGLHLVILFFGKLLNSKRWVQATFRKFLWRSVIANWNVVGDSSKMLVMEHELFRHIETELFVNASRLSETLRFIQQSMCWAAGDGASLSDEFVAQVTSVGLTNEFQAIRGSYCHHYPICIRRVLADSTMISMSSGGNEDWYAISLISYHSLSDRKGFFSVMNFIARAMCLLFSARPHWGKHNPLPANELAKLYPEMAEFKQVCNTMDSKSAFLSPWFEKLFQTLD